MKYTVEVQSQPQDRLFWTILMQWNCLYPKWMIKFWENLLVLEHSLGRTIYTRGRELKVKNEETRRKKFSSCIQDNNKPKNANIHPNT